jgi:hypothetical protein
VTVLEDAEDHVAMMFHGLVTDLQQADVARFEEEHKQQVAARAALRATQPVMGMSAAELLRKLDGDPEDADRKVRDSLDRVDREAGAAAEVKDKQEPLPMGHFPPPPVAE